MLEGACPASGIRATGWPRQAPRQAPRATLGAPSRSTGPLERLFSPEVGREGSREASKRRFGSLWQVPGPLRIALPCRRERKFSKLSFVLSKCSWAAFWQLLEPCWLSFGLHLGPLGRLLGSTWGLWGAFGAHLEAFWAPLGLHLGLLGTSWANLRPSGRQMGSKWTPSGRQMDAEWTSF